MKFDKLIEKINKINLIERFSLDKQKITLIVILSIAFLYVDFNFLLKGQLAASSKSKAELARIINDLRALDAGLKNMEAIKAGQGSGLKVQEKMVIFESGLTSLLHDISKLANANNVRILQIKPLRDSQKSAAGKFAPVLINMDLICGYHNFGKFLNQLENNQVLISVENFKIELQPQDTLRQKVNLTIKTYVRK
ncbi:MAG: type 4a pilus biogenesis protein PilO [Candidatus Omnitrophica bacterium]|jgi:Tfp pilus assembly protein PilO|nr:type 4a pilus biogenesis protein PilO [Candidatus Omnitrophota bacterium]MDD3988429.1 type 4a pilus biogenesis protein PilO [Candidatus Omnitrophota bacterium]MDD5665570.1 type 4a pilus biogenesis protein PilO [Candidatus Omnitrophota bacterium]